jgi:hypothetical protein
MNRILICSEDALSTLRITRILSQGNYAYDAVKTPIRRDDLLNYGLLIMHSSYHLQGLNQFIEHLVLAKTIPVIYLSSTIGIGGFQLLLDKPFFLLIDENKLDAELPITLKLVFKYISELKKEQDKTQKVENDLENERIFAKCKKALMDQGHSEAEAHAVIQKTAMDHQESKQAACLRILKEKNR